MRKTILTLALLTAAASPALAHPKTTTVTPASQNQGQLQGQAQGQAQGSWNTNKAISGSSSSANGVGYGSGTGIGYGGGGGGGGGGGAAQATSAGGNASTGDQRNRQSTTVNANTYEARQSRNTPGIAFQPSSLGSGSPCEGVPFGIGGSAPGLSALFQIPRESERCWGERGVNQGLLLRQQGLPISDNAIIAIYAGVPAARAIQDNPYQGRSYVARVRHAPRGRPCVPCGGRAHH